MAAVFSLLFLVAVAGFVGSLALLVVRRRQGSAALGCLPFVVLFALLLAFLVTKFVHEELIPCLAYGGRSCDFASS